MKRMFSFLALFLSVQTGVIAAEKSNGLYKKASKAPAAHSSASAHRNSAAARHALFERLVMEGHELETAGNLPRAAATYERALNSRYDAGIAARLDDLRAKIQKDNHRRSQDLYLSALNASQSGNQKQALVLCRQSLDLDAQNLQAQRMLTRLNGRLRH
jgi:hypothetical protein